MTRYFARASSLLALALMLAASAAYAASEINGRVAGYVTEQSSKSPLAEIQLTLSGPAMQRPATVTSGKNGRFEFQIVPPGENYTLEVNAQGFAPMKMTGLVVRLGTTSEVKVELVLGEVIDAKPVITTANPIINPDSQQTSYVITAEKAVATPSFQQVEGMPQQVPGVGPGNRPSTRGGLARYTKFYIDGMDTTDISEGNITSPLNFLAVENFQVVAGGYDAQYNSLGAVENVVTKTGGNTFYYDVQTILAPSFLTAKNKVPSTQPDYDTFYVNNSVNGPSTSFYSPVVAVGGPIIKDKLWFFLSGQANFSDRETLLNFGSTTENRDTATRTYLARLKLTYQPTEKDRFSFAVNLDRNIIDNRLASTGTYPEAESRIDRGGYFLILNYDRQFTDNLRFSLQTGLTYKLINTDPQIARDLSEADRANLPPSHRDASGLTQFNAGSIAADTQGNYTHELRTRFQFDPTFYWNPATGHQVKAGLQFTTMSSRLATGVYGNQRYADRSGGVCNPDDPSTFAFCNQRTDYYNLDNEQAALVTRATVQNYGVFLQDRWLVNNNLTIIPGLRADLGVLHDNTGATVGSLFGLGPRLGATYDIFGDVSNVIVASYGRSNDVGDVSIAQHSNPTLLQVTSTFNSTSNSFPVCDPTALAAGPVPGCTLAGGLTGRSFAQNQKPPYVDELSVGYHRATQSGLVLGADLTYRYYGRLWADQEINRVYDPSGTKIVGGANGTTQSILQAIATPNGYRQYTGLDLWVQGQSGPWDVLAGYTLAWNWGTVGDYFDGYLNNPRMSPLFEGWVGDDQRHTLKGSVVYYTPWGLDIGLRFQYRTGKPLWESFTNPADSSQRLYRSPRGTGFALDTNTLNPNFNDPSSWVELRGPTQTTIDLQARYNLGKALRMSQKLELGLLVVNVLNNVDATGFTDQYAATRNRYGLASGRSSAQQAEILLRFHN